MRKIKIYLYGHLKKIIPNVVEMEAETAYDAIKRLSYMYPKLQAPLEIGRYRVKIKDYDSIESLHVPLFTDELHIFPFFNLGKNSNVFNTIVGAVLIVTGMLTIYFSKGIGVKIGEGLIYAGIAMMAGGIIGMLSPAPKLDNDSGGESLTASKYLGAPKNTVAVGTRIPIGYGLFRVYGHYISFDINAVDMV